MLFQEHSFFFFLSVNSLIKLAYFIYHIRGFSKKGFFLYIRLSLIFLLSTREINFGISPFDLLISDHPSILSICSSIENKHKPTHVSNSLASALCRVHGLQSKLISVSRFKFAGGGDVG